uniref:Acetyltransferase (GNAT) family protein n=1 Tax=Candidatus Kentrum sp. SD TaxID=2126332 RepID=A0A451BKP7_9GAMM|nr:MAG: Acetyltransferase (GNAT) family protein [Candidatus Kentron sp. SD]
MHIEKSFGLITQQGDHHECKIINLDYSNLQEIYEIEMRAFKELDGQYIKKNMTFIGACLATECSVGIITKGEFIAIVTVNIEQIDNGERASILGFNGKWPALIGFIEGVYIFPKFRQCGLISILYLEAIQLLEKKKIKHIYSAIDPRNYVNIIAMMRSKFILQNLYHSNINGDLRYLMKFYPKEQFVTDMQKHISIDDHDAQRIYFEKGYVGIKLVGKDMGPHKTFGKYGEMKKPVTYMILMRKLTVPNAYEKSFHRPGK